MKRLALDRVRGQLGPERLVSLGLELGERTFISRTAYIDPGFPWLIAIGDEATLGPGVVILAHDASMQRRARRTMLARVVIGKRVFIGAGAVVLAGSRIGDDAVIGAGAVVSGEIPAGSVVVGNPARVIGDVETTARRHRQAASVAPTWPYEGWTLLHGITEERKRAQRGALTPGTVGYLEVKSPPLRIAFLTDIMTPYMVAVLEALAAKAALTALFCARNGSRGMAWRGDGQISFPHEVLDGLTIPHPSRDGTDYYLSARVLGALRRARPHAVISGGFSIPTFYAAGYSRAQRIPLLIQSDGTSRSEAALRTEQRLARQALARLAWGAVANSASAARRFEEMGFPAGRVFRAPHGTRIEPFWRVAEHRPPRRDGALRLLSAGRLIPRKGCEWLLRAVGLARREGADVHLTVVGTGTEESRLRELADELGIDVTWCGFVDQPELPALHAEADAFAFTTLDDPFGMVLLEAAASGLALIASPHAGATEELVRDGREGFVVDPRDTPALAAAIARLAGSPELRERMGRAAHDATRGRTAEATAAGYLAAVESATRTIGR